MKIFVALSLLFFSTIAFAQVKISGSIKTTKGKNLKGAVITLKNSYDGAVSDTAGNYSFTTTEKGKFELEAKATDFTPITITIDIDKAPIIYNFRLKEEVSELKAVVVSAGSFAASDKKRAATVLSTLDIVTTANANADITSAARTLPGAQQVGEQEGLFVRGGAGYETKQFIDGTYVNNPFFSGAQDIATRGRFSPFLFKGTVFSTGGYSALYGQALSSALILESIDLPERSQVDVSISPLFLGGGFQHLAKNKKSSYGITYGYTNVEPYFKLVKQTPDYFNAPAFHNLETNFRFKTKKGGMFKIYSSFTTNQLGLRNPNINDPLLKNSFGVNSSNWYNNINYRENIGNGWKLNVAASFALNKDVLGLQIQDQNNNPKVTGLSYIDNTNFNLDNTSITTQFRTVLEKKLSGLSVIRFGGEYWYNNVNSYFTNLFVTRVNTKQIDHLTSMFGEADLTITNGLAAKVGARTEYSSIINKWNIAPRLSLAYKTGKNAQMSISYGDFYQKPENLWLQAANNNLDYTKATHYLINYSKITNEQTFRVEAFYKKYTQLVKSVPVYNNNGNGFAQGFELFWRDKKTIRNLDYWISYSYLNTKRDFLNFPRQMTPSFAAVHTANFVAKRFVTKWKTGFNFTYTYATGRPYYNILTNPTTGNTYINDEGRTIPFQSLSFSLNYLPNLGKPKAKTFIVLVASVSNALNQRQVFGYNYNFNGSVKKEINPPAPQFFFLGCFINWGVDRTQDAINNNL
ncbi:MAG: TonB-dependent receptor [Chitinophagaceae bacterium]